jgi:hypothetical protein
MNHLSSAPSDARPEHVLALANQYADQHKGIANTVTALFIPSRLLLWLGIEFQSTQGYLLLGLFYLLLSAAPALILTAITGQWACAPLANWTLVTVGLAVLLVPGYPLWQAASNDIVALHRALADEETIRRLMAWDRRWFSARVTTSVSTALALATVVLLLVVPRHGQGAPLPAGTVLICAVIAFLVGNTYSTLFIVPVEACLMSTCRYELYRLSPFHSLALQQAVRGYNQLGVVTVPTLTLLILMLVLLLPASSNLLAPLVVALLLLEYFAVTASMIVPRLMIGRIMRAKKEEEMKPLRRRLNTVLPRLEELTEEQYEGLKRLQETHDAIRDSPENLLPLGEIAKVVGAVLLSTITVLVTAFAQEWFAELAKRLLP